MGRRRCCCGCVTFTDLFNRANSTDIGADWQECAGDWEIYKNTLTCDEDDAVISCLHMVGWPVGLATATVVVNDPIARGINSFGGIAQIYAYVGTEALPCSGAYGEWRLELTVTDADDGELRLYYGGTLIGTRMCKFEGMTTKIYLCVGETEIKASCEHMIGFPIWTCLDEPGAHWFALGSGAADAIYYDAFTYSDHYDHDPTCPNCDLPCCCPCIEASDQRPNLTATIIGDCEGTMTGASATLTCGGLPSECCVWSTSEYGPLSFVCFDEESIHTLAVSMECLGNSCEDYVMTVSWPGDNGGNAACCLQSDMPATRGVVGPCDCHPLSITFGPFRLWRNPSVGNQYCCLCCEEFYIVVTL